MNNPHGHTKLDLLHLANPSQVEPRRQAVPCTACMLPTFNVGGRCDTHYPIPTATTTAEVDAAGRFSRSQFTDPEWMVIGQIADGLISLDEAATKIANFGN